MTKVTPFLYIYVQGIFFVINKIDFKGMCPSPVPNCDIFDHTVALMDFVINPPGKIFPLRDIIGNQIIGHIKWV